MSSSEKFCLKWNEFERNISYALREFKEDKDFYDVVLACEDKQIEAHKIIISACSPLFKSILKRHPHNSPLLYLKGVRYQDMLGLLDFMYYGEVNVAQAEINTFLAAAEELQIKGLTQKEKNKDMFATEGNDSEVLVPPKKGPEEVKTFHIKSEPSLVQYNEEAVGKRDLIEATDHHDGYDSTGYINEEEYHDEQEYNWKFDANHLWTGGAEQRAEVPCPICGKVFKTRGSLASHKYAYHRDVTSAVNIPPPPPNPLQLLDFQMDTSLESKDKDIECPICHKFFSTRGSLATHKYNYHRNASSLQPCWAEKPSTEKPSPEKPSQFNPV